jgi:hypothetical protein
MKRSRSAAVIAIVFSVGFALPALSQDASTTLQKLQQLQQQRQAARQAALANGPQKPPPQPTTPPPQPTPALTQTRPLPTNTPPLPTTTATATTTASASAAASASAHPKTVAVSVPAGAPIDRLRATRNDRRHAEVERLQQRWGDLLADDRAKEELRVHAQRMAYLQRIRGLAQGSNDVKLVESVDQLVTQEERRDADAMNALRSGAK